MTQRTIRTSLFTAVFIFYGLPAYRTSADINGLQANQTQKSNPSSSTAGAWYGLAVSRDGDRSLIGAPNYRNTATTLGGAGFMHASTEVPPWSAQQLANVRYETGDLFGFSVSVDGDLAAIAAPLYDSSVNNAGEVSIWIWDDGRDDWLLAQFLDVSLPRINQSFGASVSLSGTRLAIGAPGGLDPTVSGNAPGAVFLYDFNPTNGFVFAQKIDGPQDGAYFGYAVAMDGDQLLVGAPGTFRGNIISGHRSGLAYAYEWVGSNWQLDESILPPNPATGDLAGFSVDLDNRNHLCVGIPGANNNQGAVHIEQWTGPLVQFWGFQQTVTAFDGAVGDTFGRSVAIDGNFLLAGAPNKDTGVVYPFLEVGTTWSNHTRFTGGDSVSGDQFGSAVSLDVDQALVGAPSDDETLSDSGAAFMFTLIETNVNRAPTAVQLDTPTIPEHATNDTVVGTLSTTDPTPGQPHTYTLLNDAGGKFALGGAQTNQVVVADALDFETRPSHNISVRSTDDCGLSVTQQITIAVTDVELPVTITLSDLEHGYDGSPHFATITTAPTGVPVSVIYVPGGDPVNAGSYLVDVSAAANSDYVGSTNGTLVITPIPVTVTLSNLQHNYDGTPKPATVSTTPPGIATEVTYNGSTNLPVNAGSYTVVATVTEANYAGNSTNTLIITGLSASIRLFSQFFTYDGSPKMATAQTTPNGLAYEVTYDGSTSPPINAGTYQAIATLTEPNYEPASATNTFTIRKASQTITFPQPADMEVLETQTLLATASSGLPVTYDVTSFYGNIIGDLFTATREGLVYIYARQEGNENYHARFASAFLQVGPKGNQITPLDVSYSFGSVLDMHDQTLVIAGDDRAGDDLLVPLWIFEQDGTGTWIEQQVLQVPATATHNDLRRVSLFGNWLAAQAGSQTYLYKKNGPGNWQLLQTLQRGGVLALSGNFFYIGGGTRVEAYRLDDTDTWQFAGIPYHDGCPHSVCGSRVANLDAWGDRLVLGVSQVPVQSLFNTNRLGVAYVIECNEADEWERVAELQGSDAVATDIFGSQVAICGDTVLVGCRGVNFGEGPAFSPTQSAYVFEEIGGTWQETAKLIPQNDGPLIQTQAADLALFGDQIVLGTPRAKDNPAACYSYQQAPNGDWLEQPPLHGPGSYQRFGSALALWEDACAISTPSYYSQQPGSGIVCPFTLNPTPANLAPAAIALSTNMIAEALPTNIVVGAFSTTDTDAIDTFFAYELVSGPGDTDNARFRIGGLKGNRLYARETFDFEAQSSHQVRVRSSDVRGLSIEQVFPIQIINLPEDATITISDLVHGYDGTPKTAQVTTDPPGLPVETRYAGSLTAPIDVGDYAVSAMIIGGSHIGSANATLSITSAVQFITFDHPGDFELASTLLSQSRTVTPVASSDLPVTLSSSAPEVVSVNPNPDGSWRVLALAPGSALLTATQPGNTNYLPAAPVSQTVNVTQRTVFEELVVPESVDHFYIGVQQEFTTYAHSSAYIGNFLGLDGDHLFVTEVNDVIDDPIDAVTIYERSGPGEWYELDTINPPSIVSEYFGRAVASDGGHTLISDSRAFAQRGNVRRYTPKDGYFAFSDTLYGDFNRQEYGRAVAISGPIAMVSHVVNDPPSGCVSCRGAIDLYTWTDERNWIPVGTIDLENLTVPGGPFPTYALPFARTLALDGQRAVIGAPTLSTSIPGMAFLTTLGEDGAPPTLFPVMPDAFGSSEFSSAVAISGNIAVIGDHEDATAGARSGAATIYEQQEDGSWTLITKLLSPSPKTRGHFGFKVDLEGVRLVISERGSGSSIDGTAYLYQRNSAGVWEELFRFPDPPTSGFNGPRITDIKINEGRIALAYMSDYLRDSNDRFYTEQSVCVYELVSLPVADFDAAADLIFIGLPPNSPLRNLEGDPDNDGRKTLMEIASGTDPFTFTPRDDPAGTVPFFAIEDGGEMLSLFFNVPLPLPSVRYAIQCSDQLGLTAPWQTILVVSTTLFDKQADSATLEVKVRRDQANTEAYYRLVFETP